MVTNSPPMNTVASSTQAAWGFQCSLCSSNFTGCFVCFNSNHSNSHGINGHGHREVQRLQTQINAQHCEKAGFHFRTVQSVSASLR